ncbi:MAG: cyanophycinase [Saprospiraceae bacterium]|nr:cyanophycinase [Saprospiraceae bacterium]MBK7810411.1 cyanophycinase [Saprospiraceae bacterium]MBK9630007.1 cyanophycinase [Saprospiraceae bacterium]
MNNSKIFKGTLIPIGGNEDKGSGPNEMYTHDFIQAGILSNVVKESGGNQANIVVITTASQIPKEVGKNYQTAFHSLGCSNLHVLDIRSKKEAESQKVLQRIEKADCVMFSGGDQSEIIKHIEGTQLHQLIFEKLEQSSFVVAGTSAGAMCMSQEMIAGGSSPDALKKGNVKMKKGMGFIQKAIIDSHFIQRGRFGRLAEAMAQFPELLGIGLAEDTAIVIKNSNECKVIGSGMIILFDALSLTHNRFNELNKDTPLSIANLTTHILAYGDRFSLNERKIEIFRSVPAVPVS